MRKGGTHYEKLSKHEKFSLIEYYVDNNQIEEAYKVLNERGGQLVGELTLYLRKEHLEVFHVDPLSHLDYVPENYLYEAVDENLCVHVNDGITKIKDNAFAFCNIKKLIISNKVKYIGDNALALNSGEIIYQGTVQEFINTCLGKSKCFARAHHDEMVIECSNGPIVIKI